MARWQDKAPQFTWQELEVTDEDWAAQSPADLRCMLLQLLLIRAFENRLLELKARDLIHGPVHTSIGQEAVAVGTMAALRPEDGTGGTHRAHHQYLAKLLSHDLPGGFDPLASALPDGVQEEIAALMAEIMGLRTGCCRGRGGSMHLCNPRIGVLGTNAIVAGGIPLAAGAAFAAKFRRTGGVAVSFFGDGAVNQGAFHEALNLAGLWRLPLLCILENNLYAVATTTAESCAVPDISVRAAAYAMPALVVDGMDVLAMKLATARAADGARRGEGPWFIEARTYRYLHHAGEIHGSAFGYRPRDEEEQYRRRDPLQNARQRLDRMGVLDAEQVRHVQEMADQAVRTAATGLCRTGSDGAVEIVPDLWPAVQSLTEGLRGATSDPQAVDAIEQTDHVCPASMKYVEAIAAVTGRWLQQDPAVLVLGEEVGHMRGGAYAATRGLAERFPGRVLDTPISEAGFCGLAGGAAMAGLRPIVEIMFPDFALVAADQIFNQIGKLRHMYGGHNVEIPLVMRTRIAIGCGYGGQHSMDPVALFSLFPGWRVVAPATPFDYVGLFNSAMACRSPVLIVEHHELYPQDGPVPEGEPDWLVPIGRAKVVRPGRDVTILSYGWAVALATRAADALAAEGIEAEVIDLRTLSLPDIDYQTIGQSFGRTKVMLIVEQAPSSNSIGARLAGECQRRFFDDLDAPICTLAGADVPNPVSRVLEQASLPTESAVRDAIRDLAHRRV